MLPAALGIPAFRRLFIGSTLSQFGSSLTFIVLPLVMWDATGSAAAFASSLAAAAAAVIVAMPLGGVLADRFDRRRLMMAQDLFGIIAMIATVAIVRWELWLAIPLVTFTISCFSSLCASAAPALRRDVLPEELRIQGNALLQLGTQGSTLFAPIAGAAMYAAVGFELVALIDIATFAISFVLVAGLRGVRTRADRAAVEVIGLGGAMATAVVDVRVAIRAIRRDTYLAVGVLPTLVNGMANALLLTAAVPWFERSLNAPGNSWAIMITILGAGGVISSLGLTRVGDRVSAAKMLRVSSIAGVIAAVCFMGTPSLLLVWFGCALFGLMSPVVFVASSTIDQMRIPSGLQGRISSLDVMLFHTGMASGAAAGAALVGFVGPSVAMSGFAAFMIMSSVLWIAQARLADRPIVLTEDDVDAILGGAAATKVADRDLAVGG